MKRASVAMDGSTHAALAAHLLRADGQEDLCLALWRPSTGQFRETRIVQNPILPRGSDRAVHGNASFSMDYVLRAARLAADEQAGLVFLHSHPAARGWQAMSSADAVAEQRIANLAREATGLPLLGLTLAGGDRAWSARTWDEGAGREISARACEAVRVFGAGLTVTFDDSVIPPPARLDTQIRTVDVWGDATQSMIARLSVLVVGAGSVGMAIAEALARCGIQRVGVMDFDTVELVNLDRIRGATVLDAALLRSKSFVAGRLLASSSTATSPQHQAYEWSVCEPQGSEAALDYDVVFSCVDRPWPRHVLNALAFADVIPVIDGGLRAFPNPDGSLRNAYWRSAVVGPGRPCLACLGQYDPALVQVERDGSLDDPRYIERLPEDSPLRARQNVSALSAAVSSALLLQFVSLVAKPSGLGDPGPMRFDLRGHSVDRDGTVCTGGCLFQRSIGTGDTRPTSTGRHLAAEHARDLRRSVGIGVRLRRTADSALLWMHSAIK